MLVSCSAPAPAASIPTIADALPTPQPEKQTLLSASEQREHLRILAAYGGVYREPRVQQMLEKTVDKLVAASERPELKYEVTILNSPAVNAFALPNGQLYVTRGLVALANDNSELASVMAHEMAHVIARHAEIREDQARQAALVNRVATDLLSDPQLGALALAKSKITLANFSRAQEFEADGIGVGISARAGFDPYGAERFLTSMGMNSHLRAQRASIDPRAPDFLSSHPATPERVTNAVANARQYHEPGRRPARPQPNISAKSTGSSMARTRARASCAAGGSCIPSSASPSPRRRALRSTTRRRRCSASRTTAPRRSASTSFACRPSSRCRNISTPAGSRTSRKRASRR